MYTRCPHCTTIFQVTAEQLRTSDSHLPCVTCSQPFNVLDSLADDVTTLITMPAEPDAEPEDDETFDGADTEVDEQLATGNHSKEHADDAAAADNEQDTGDQDTGGNLGHDESEDDETAQEETLDDADSEEGTRDQPLPDLSDIDPDQDSAEDLGDDEPEVDEPEVDEPEVDEPEVDEPEVDEPEVDEPEVDESEQEKILADADSDEDTRDQPLPNLSGIDPDHVAGDDLTDDEPPVESMEFNAPEQTWTRFFLSDDANTSPDRVDRKPAPEAEREPWISDTDAGTFEVQTNDQDEWQEFLAELGDDQSTTPAEDERQIAIDEPNSSDDSDLAPDEPFSSEFAAAEPQDEDESSIILPWLTDEASDQPSEQRRIFRLSGRALGACAALALLLGGQLVHYNRDALAANMTYGATVRGVYGLFGAPLYPDWPIDAFEVTGTEAIAGRSAQDALDILANVVVSGRQPIGLPLIRIVLRDRWTTPVASRVFEPDEYLRHFDPANPLVSPGTALAVEISVADPGTEALGYVVDVCLPRRKTGLECQIAKDPFQ